MTTTGFFFSWELFQLQNYSLSNLLLNYSSYLMSADFLLCSIFEEQDSRLIRPRTYLYDQLAKCYSSTSLQLSTKHIPYLFFLHLFNLHSTISFFVIMFYLRNMCPSYIFLSRGFIPVSYTHLPVLFRYCFLQFLRIPLLLSLEHCHLVHKFPKLQYCVLLALQSFLKFFHLSVPKI